jgi:hypothetical protein
MQTKWTNFRESQQRSVYEYFKDLNRQGQNIQLSLLHWDHHEGVMNPNPKTSPFVQLATLTLITPGK